MFKPLLRVLPALSGNVTISCNLNDFVQIDDEVFECYVRTAKLLPLSSNLFKKNMNISLLNSSYEWDLKKFYTFYYPYFWKSWFTYLDKDLPRYDKHTNNVTRDIDFEYGCKRLSYQEFNKQFSFFAPIYLESENDIPDCFELEIDITVQETYKVKKKIRINMANDPAPHNYLYTYLKTFTSRLDDNVLFFRIEDKECIYSGIDLKHGGFIKSTDKEVGKLFLKQNTINNFDNVICKGFERNNIVMKQVLPLSFSFNVNDILSESDKLKFHNANLHISGRWIKDGFPVNLYDWHYDYTKFYQQVKRVNNQTGLMDWEYPVVKTKLSKSKSHSGAIGKPYKSANVGIPNDIDYSRYANIMDMGFPSLNECRFKKYRNSNKISPNYNRWKLKYSDDNHPYVTNFSAAFSLINNDFYSEYPQKYNDSTGIVRKQYNAYYNLILPIGEQGKTVYEKVNQSFYDKYINTRNKYCSEWFELIRFDIDNPVENSIINNKSFRNVHDNKCYFNGILYNLDNIYVGTGLKEKIDKWGVFMTLDFKPINPATLDNQFFANYVIYKEHGKYIKNPNTFINDNVLTDDNTFLFKDISSGWLTDEMVHNVSFTINEDNYGDFINIIDYDIDYYTANKFYKWADIEKYVDEDSYFTLRNYIHTNYEKLPIYKLSNVLNDKTKKIKFNLSNVNNLYYSITDNCNVNNLTTYSILDIGKLSTVKNGISFFQENEFISSYDLSYVISEKIIKLNTPLAVFGSSLNNYLWNPVLTDASGQNIVARNCFEKISGKLSKFYGNDIPERYKDIDNDVLYIDPYNYNNIVDHYNNYWLKYQDFKLHKIGEAGNDTFEHFTHYAKFLNLAHLLYYIKFIYDDPNASKERMWHSFEDIYIRKRIYKYDIYNIDIDDLYIPLSEYFIIKPNMTDEEFNELTECVASSIKYIEETKTFRFDDIPVHNKRLLKINYNPLIHTEDISNYYISETATDYIQNIIIDKTMGNEIDGDKFKFDLCYKKDFIKINEEIWKLINIEEDFYGAPYKDLYIYEFERKDDFNQNYNIYEQKDDDYKKWKSNSLECLTPLFFNIFLEEKEDTKIFCEYNLYNIFDVNVIDDKGKKVDTLYRRNMNNVLCMMDISQFPDLKSYTTNKEITESCIKIKNTWYMYENAYMYYKENGYLDNPNANIMYFPRTFDRFTHNHTSSEKAHWNKSYTYIDHIENTYEYIDKISYNYYNQKRWDSIKDTIDTNITTYEKIIDPITLTTLYKTTTVKPIEVLVDSTPIYGIAYNTTYFDDLGLYEDFGINTYRHVDLENNKITNYGFIVIKNTFNNTSNALNLIEETGESVKYVSYINNQNIIENRNYVYDIYKQSVPFIKNNALITLLSNYGKVLVFPKHLNMPINYSFNEPNDILFDPKSKRYTILERYFDNVVPLITETSAVDNAYVLKYKSKEKSFNTKLGDVMYGEQLSLDNYPGVKVYSLEDKAQLSYTVNYDEEWKHFNTNKYYNLKEYFEIDIKNLLSYPELVYYQGEDETIEHFKNYMLDSLNNNLNEDQILFLFNRYTVKYSHNCDKLTDDLNSKLYKLKYIFSLK